MCHPCWLNIKRFALNYCATKQVGQTFQMVGYLMDLPGDVTMATVMARFEEEWGVLLILDLKSSRTYGWTGPHALWCPKFGSGGWVDQVKDTKVKAILDEAKAAQKVALLLEEVQRQIVAREREREAVNCLAL